MSMSGEPFTLRLRALDGVNTDSMTFLSAEIRGRLLLITLAEPALVNLAPKAEVMLETAMGQSPVTFLSLSADGLTLILQCPDQPTAIAISYRFNHWRPNGQH